MHIRDRTLISVLRFDHRFKHFSGEDTECCSTHLIDGDGTFNIAGIESFMKDVKLAECGLSYAVVSIMGPQSSGPILGRWMLLREGMYSQISQDDTAFEKQSALFALAVSDIVLINMWCHDIGREQAANKPLLKTVFQVMMRLFSPRKTTLMFVIRDKTRTPLENLEPVLREDIQKIWDSVPKPEAHKETPLSEFFNVEVVALSSYEEKEEQFKEQVISLRQRFYQSIAPGGLAGDRRGVVPASGFSFSAQQIWKVIKENKDLDLPAHKVMVATVRCEEISSEKLSSFVSNEEWCQLDEVVQNQPVSGFGKKLSSILATCLSEYDMEATYFDEGVRSAKRQQLEEKLLQGGGLDYLSFSFLEALDITMSLNDSHCFLTSLVQPAYQSMLGHIRSGTLDRFKEAFDKALNGGERFSVAAHDCSESFMIQFDEACADAIIEQATWDSSKVRDKFRRDIDAHVDTVRAAKLSELTTQYEKKLNEALLGPVDALLDGAGDDTWPAIRKLLRRETESAVFGLSAALSSFDMDEQTKDKMLNSLKDFARGIIESKAKEEAGRVLFRMKDRFSTIFSHDSDSMPRIWSGKEDIRAITKMARSASLKMLSVMAAIRLDDDTDNIEKTLVVALVDTRSGGAANKTITSADPLASSTWEEVPSSKTLITPVQCKALWRQFKAETEYSVTQAISAQAFVFIPSLSLAQNVLMLVYLSLGEASKRNNNWLPPPWAMVALVVLGFNEFMTLLRNPLYLGLIFVGFLLVKALWVQLDISGEFRNGALPGLLSLSTKFLPTVMNLLRKLAEEGTKTATTEPQRNHPLPPKTFQSGVNNNGDLSSTASSEVTSAENGTEYSVDT
ncbi:hypothetical protein TEA_004299 [Camellia sinensis var. sinensis]|uniref:GB1/RHD3-type G domain-containing protein n=1 Tax=Camellia sinensis var. sinensis TaxID=542762 RepID=A0A4S4E7H6_CAMSN|nr:hypothetical protein TEA_004299 [Camellia sinensis var. sinensis]